MKCFNCGGDGHGVRDCPKPRDPEKTKSNYELFVSRKKASEEPKAMDMLGMEHKRVRVEDLVDYNVSPQVVKTVQEVKIDIAKKGRPNKANELLVERSLDTPTNLTLKEVFKLKPSLVKNMLGELVGDKKEVLLAESDEPLNGKDTKTDALSYLLVTVGGKEISLFVDVEASCCNITKSCLLSMELPFSPEGSISAIKTAAQCFGFS
jgi:hypothetical protein